MSTAQQEDTLRVAPEIVATLSGRHFGLFGFTPDEAGRIAELLRQTKSLSACFEETWLSASAYLGDAVVVKLDGVGPRALRAAANCSTPVLLVGPDTAVLAGDGGAYHWSRDFLHEPWTGAELLVRLFRLVAPSRASTPHVGERRQPFVLIADDDASWTILVETTLRNHGYACQTANDGLTALHLARQLLPDLLLLDVKMPAMNGFEVLETIRREPLLEQLPVGLLTGCMNEDEVQRGSALHADDYIIKPVSPTVLINRIKRLLVAASPPAGVRPVSAPPAPAAEPAGPADAREVGPDQPPGFDELRSQYLENRTVELASLASALRQADFETLTRAGHNLKGTGAAYGFEELSQLGKALETAAQGQDAAQVEALLGKTESYLTQERSAVRPK